MIICPACGRQEDRRNYRCHYCTHPLQPSQEQGMVVNQASEALQCGITPHQLQVRSLVWVENSAGHLRLAERR